MAISETLVATAVKAGLGRAGKTLLGALRDFEQKNDDRLREAWTHDRRDHLVRKVYWLEKTLEDLASRVEDIAAEVDAQSQDTELHRIWDNFVYEAIREATPERREMLAAADAGIVAPSMTITQKARVERALRQLDPEDVRALYGIRRTWVASFEEWREVWEEIPNGDLLVAAGCIRIKYVLLPGSPGKGLLPQPVPSITPLGDDVLQVLREYVRDRGATFSVRGRDPEPDETARKLAWDRVDEVPGLRDFLALARRVRSVKGTRVYNPPRESLPSAVLWIAGLIGTPAEDAARRLSDCNTYQRALEVKVDDADGLSVCISGPHEVLRVVADDGEIDWI